MTEKRLKQLIKKHTGLKRLPDTVELNESVVTAYWYGNGKWILPLSRLIRACSLTGKALSNRKTK